MADVIRETGAGLVLPGNDELAAARMISTFLADPIRVKAAREAARHLADTRFSRSHLFDEFEKVLVDVTERSSLPAR